MKVSKNEVKSIVERAFPEYSGRKFFTDNTGKFTAYNLNWCDGSRNYYRAVSMTDERINSIDVPAPWMHNSENQTVEIPTGWVVVCHSIFCGKDMGLTVYYPAFNQITGAR